MTEPRTAAELRSLIDTLLIPRPAGVRRDFAQQVVTEALAEARAAGASEAAQLDVAALAAALPGVMSAEAAAEVYGEGTDPLDVPEEWYMTPREMAEKIVAKVKGTG